MTIDFIYADVVIKKGKCYETNNLYHGSHTNSIKNRKLWENSKDKIREKYFLCYNRLPKPHRALTVLSLYKNNNLDKGIVSFPNYGMSSWDSVREEKQ